MAPHSDYNLITVPNLTPTRLCLSDMNRTRLVLAVNVGAVANVGPIPNVTTLQGLTIRDTILPLVMDESVWGDIVKLAWYGTTTAVGGATIAVIQVWRELYASKPATNNNTSGGRRDSNAECQPPRVDYRMSPDDTIYSILLRNRCGRRRV